MDQMNQQPNNATASYITDWEAVNREWKESGLTQKVFCRDREISVSTFLYHRSKILEKQAGSKPRQFKEVKVKHDTAPLACRDLAINLPNGVRLSVPAGFCVDQLKMVLSALGMKAC